MSLRAIKREIICHDLDIVPIATRPCAQPLAGRFQSFATAAEALAHMPPEDARRMKRKFRKLWRSAAKKLKDNSYKRKMGLGVREPTPKHKSERTILVSGMVFEKVNEKFGKEW